MQTRFSDQQLQDPRIAEANEILRRCVHCGFCTATCPTYLLRGDELDSPRGRIYLIKQMLEEGRPASREDAKHIDRCLSCLSCTTTCPSGVDYMHLIDQARVHVDKTLTRPLGERLIRRGLMFVLPNPKLFNLGMRASHIAKPFSGLIKKLFGEKLAAMLDLTPQQLPQAEKIGTPGLYPANGKRKGRVALLAGCAQQVLDPQINAATIRLLNRLGIEVVVAKTAGCCGALTHHMGKENDALNRARRNINAWLTERLEDGGLDAIIITASGCGTTVKDYGHMLAHDTEWCEKAAVIAGLAKDITEYLTIIGLGDISAPQHLNVTYHSACSMQHGQKIKDAPLDLLRQAGFQVSEVPEGHICCGSAGTYNILQPAIAEELRLRKQGNITTTNPQVIAAGNIGCMVQIGRGMDVPVVHTVELLDWATGGPMPDDLKSIPNLQQTPAPQTG